MSCDSTLRSLAGQVRSASDRELGKWGILDRDALPVRWHTAADNLFDRPEKIHGSAEPVPLGLCGNVWEWCSTESSPGRHELKGGAWTSPFERCAPPSFNDAAETMCDDDPGFRCAVPADELKKLLGS